MCKLSFKLILVFFVFVMLSTSAYAEEAFVIDKYKISIDIGADRTYSFNESLDVNFSSRRHGIYKTIPRSSSVEKYLVRDVRAIGDEYDTETTADEVKIQIGDEDKYVSGKKNYNIVYKLKHIKDDAGDGDYAYINVIGTGWDTTIHSASAVITLPTDKIDEVTLTSGVSGLKDNEKASYTTSGNTIFVSAEGLNNYEGVTIMIKMPEGTFCDAPDSFYPYANIVQWVLTVFAMLMLLLIIVFYFKYGRDKQVIPVVEFYPPDNMNPTDIGYVIDRETSSKDVISLVFYWAAKGYLRYEEGDDSSYVLYKLREIDDKAPLYEQTAFNELWRTSGANNVSSSELKDTYYVTVSKTVKAVPMQFYGVTDLDNHKSETMSFVGAALACLAGVLPMLVQAFYLSSFSYLIFILYYIVSCVVMYGLYKKTVDRQFKSSAIRIVMLQLLFYVVAFIVSWIISGIYSDIGVFGNVPMHITYALSYLGCNIAVFINQRSEYGQKTLERVVGFKEFLETAEKERLEALVDENPTYFYDILPYAIVLGVTKKWSQKFADIATEPPSWYSTTSSTPFSTMVFYGNISHSMQNMYGNMTSSPSSDGSGSGSFGGGGFSGGGSGGGGGGSW